MMMITTTHTFIPLNRAARMVLETGKHPAGLKDDVCSPAGCTINAMYHLEKHGFRSMLMDAVQLATKVSKSNSQ